MWTRYGLISTKGDSIRKFHKTLPGENAIFICPIQTATSCRLLVHYNDSRELRWRDESPMAVSIEMQHTGDPNMQAEVRAVVEHVLADRPGGWRVSITGLKRMSGGD